jgi:hypothetical protein
VYQSEEDWLPRHDFVLAYPAEVVWPYLLNWDSWITSYRMDHLDGPIDQAGEIKLITAFDEAGSPIESFRIEIARAQPNRRLVYRLLELESPLGTIDRIDGYQVFNLIADGARSLVTFETVARVCSTHPADQLAAQIEEMYPAGERAWSQSYIPKLRELLAA